MTPSTAVITGIGRTGRLVTSAALILFFAFSALASSPGTDGKIIGTALGVGILLDATVVRALLVPALVSLFGRWNWWLPDWLARILFVAAVPPPPRAGPPTPYQQPTTSPPPQPSASPNPTIRYFRPDHPLLPAPPIRYGPTVSSVLTRTGGWSSKN